MKNTILVTGTLLSLTFPLDTLAQPAAPANGAAQDGSAPAEHPQSADFGEAAAPEAEAEPGEPAEPPLWKTAMSHYELGDPDKALEILRGRALECGQAGEPQCKNSERGALYACVAIVLAGGKGNHNGSVQAFKKAMVFMPSLGLSREYRTKPVEAAFNEASGIEPVAPAVAPVAAAPASPDVYPSGSTEWGKAPERESKTGTSDGLIMVSGGVKGGFISTFYGAVGLAQIGGSVNAALTPGGALMGLRARGGGLVGDGALGYIGASALIGGVFGPRVGNRFGFFAFGAGFESYPAGGGVLFAPSLMLGGSLGGFAYTFGIDTAFGSGGGMAAFGVEIGYGGLL